MSNMKWTVENHTGIDKSFEVGNNHISVKVDYDDVNHMEVDAASKHMKEIMEKYWDEKVYESYYMKEVLRVWEENEYNLQSDYESRDKYLENYGITVDRKGKIE